MVTFSKDNEITVKTHMRDGNGDIILAKLLPENPAHTRLFNVITINPGCSIGYHVHQNETEMFYFISGKGKVKDDDQEIEVTAGDAMSTGSGHCHGVECIGDEPLKILACIVLD